MAHSVLQVPVPGLEPFVRARTEHYDTDYLSTDPAFTHAHITVLGPFLPELDERAAGVVAEVVGSVAAFTFRLDAIDTFPNGCIHLRPQPDSGFRELTARLWEAFPQCPPYAGAFPDSVPHLTLDLRHADVTEETTATLLETSPRPSSHRADRVDLAWYEPGRCRRLRAWSLGESAAR